MKPDIPIVEITKIPRHSYYEWFILGFYELERKGEIRFRLNVDWVRTIAKYTSCRLINGGLKRVFRRWEDYNLEGTITFQGKVYHFCIDGNDTPNAYDALSLEKMDRYFKMQCPASFEPEGFHLTDKVYLPWCDHRDTNGVISREGERALIKDFCTKNQRVRPLMVGPRMLSWGLSYRALKQSYEEYLSGSKNIATKKLMSYFGNTQGPKPTPNCMHPNFNNESDVMAFGRENVNHPNEKREIANDYLNTLGDQYDARMLSEHVPGKENLPGQAITHPELFIPRNKFCEHISHFQYNLNISGFTMSIPNRFIESFMVGTAIITDKLALRWYAPFGKEVFETVPMGYMPKDNVDWEKFKQDILQLPSISKQDVLNAFEQKWKPEVVARYIIQEVLCSDN